MKKFSEAFHTRLWDAISEIEDNSLIEVVVIIKPRSAHYDQPQWQWGALIGILAYTYLMFTPTEFDYRLIYAATIIFFMAGFFVGKHITPLRRLFISKRRMRRQVEVMGRGLFQKGGIRHTNAKIGTLIYVSMFEKLTLVLPDRGAENAIPAEKWDEIDAGFQSIFTADDPGDALIEQLAKCRPIFARYIPPVENDINELPDNMEVDL